MSRTSTFVFDTVNGALWAEETARARSIPVEVVPSPPGAGAACDLALVTPTDRTVELERALAQEGVSFRIWPG